MNSDVVIQKSGIEGKGLFANRKFKKGELVIKWNLNIILTKEEVKKISENERRYVYPLKDKFLLQQPPARYVNHSCDPNTKVVDDSSDVALRDIEKGEEITSDYSDSFVPGESMGCKCGSKNCKSIIGQDN
ncbi:hypothetical protein CL619_01020 [archaeon]|nr:hypothetical protein [archaeon]|tara:strand:- start:8422 stop:8814 length:393 start_codon:yes stop_codon:yes gene_type:complete